MHKHTHTAYAGYKPVFNDSCYAEPSEIAALSWELRQDSETVHRYEVLYTPTMCNASTSNVTMEGLNLTNETRITLPPSKVYCIQVNVTSAMSWKCAQVASLKQSMK